VGDRRSNHKHRCKVGTAVVLLPVAVRVATKTGLRLVGCTMLRVEVMGDSQVVEVERGVEVVAIVRSWRLMRHGQAMNSTTLAVVMPEEVAGLAEVVYQAGRGEGAGYPVGRGWDDEEIHMF
jgi:hypothetical protein